MRAAAVGDPLDQRRAEVGARTLGGPVRGCVHRQEVVAVDPQRRQAVAHALPAGAARTLSFQAAFPAACKSAIRRSGSNRSSGLNNSNRATCATTTASAASLVVVIVPAAVLEKPCAPAPSAPP